MAKASNIPLLKQEKTLLADIKKQKEANIGLSGKEAEAAQKVLDKIEDQLDTLRSKNTEVFSYLKLSKELIKASKEHGNVLVNQKAIWLGIREIGKSINKEAAKGDKLSKKLVKNYQGVLDLSQTIMMNTRAIGTEEFQKVNITRKIIELKKLEGEVTEDGRKKDLAKAIQLLELQKKAQGIMEQMHNSSQAAAKTMVAPFKKVVDTLGSVPLIGGLIQSSFGGVLDEWQESLSARIGKAMSGGLDKAPANVGEDAKNEFIAGKKSEGKGRWGAYKKGDWAEEKKKREEGAEYDEDELAAAAKKSKYMKINLAVLGAVGLIWAKIGKYAFDTGLSMSQIGKLGPQLLINSQAVEAFAEEFGTVGELSTGLAISLRKQTFQYGVQAKDVAKLMKLQQGMTGATKESISADLPGMYKEARKAGVSPAKLMETMAGSSEFLAKYVGGSVKEMGAFAIQAAKSGVSLQAIEASMKGALDWETSIGKEMEASMLLGRDINLDRFRQLSFAGDTKGAMSEQLRILKSFGPLENLRIDQKEMLGDLFNTEFSQIVSMQREQDILNNATSKQNDTWTAVTGQVMIYGSTLAGMMPGILTAGSQLSMIWQGAGGQIIKAGQYLKKFTIFQNIAAKGGLRAAAIGVGKAAIEAATAAAKTPIIGPILSIAAMAAVAAAGWSLLSKSKAKGRASGGPVKGMNPYMVGERGPELFIPATGGNIIPNNRMANGSADRVYGDTADLQAGISKLVSLGEQAEVDRKRGSKEIKDSIWDASRTD